MIKEFYKIIKEYRMVKNNDKVLLAISGGKDSIAMLYLFSKLREKINFEFEVIHVYLGIRGFSDISLEVVKKHCEKLNVKLNVVKPEKYIDEIDPKKFNYKSKCSICSIAKRYLIHKFAYENGFNKVATAHTLEDFCRFILSFYLDGNINVLTRLYPITKSEVTNIEFIKPLFLISEEEIKEFIKDKEYVQMQCPYSIKKLSKNVRILESLNINERKKLVLNFIRYVYPALSEKYMKKIEIKKCECGMPTIYGKCSYCRIFRES